MLLKQDRAPALVAMLQLCAFACLGSAESRAAENAKSVPAAQTRQYPSRSVRFIIPFPPSGGTDIIGRVIGQKLGDRLGQPFIIDNRAGAAGTIGSGIAAKAAADGYTILLATASFAISTGFYQQLPYDSVRDFDAVGRLASGPLLMVVHPSVPARSMKELIAFARENPDKLNYASGGEGGINHLPAEMLKHMTGIRITHIPYKGSGPALTALLAGESQLMIAPLGPSLALVRAGRLRALAVGGARRTALLPELPTVIESGVPGYEADNWYGMLAPRGTPPNIINLLNAEIRSVLENDDTRERFAALGFEPLASTPAQFAAHLKSEIEQWGRALKAAGVQPQ